MRKHRDFENLPAFSVTRKRRKSFPSETHVKRGRRFVHGDVELIENSVAMTCARAAPNAGFKACCMKSGAYDGSNRDDYFQRVEHLSSRVRREMFRVANF